MYLQYKNNNLSLVTKVVSQKRDKKNPSIVTTIIRITILILRITMIIAELYPMLRKSYSLVPESN